MACQDRAVRPGRVRPVRHAWPGVPAALFDDLGHQIQPILCCRRATLIIGAPIFFCDNIFAQAQRQILQRGRRMAQRFDAAGVDLSHLLDQRKIPFNWPKVVSVCSFDNSNWAKLAIRFTSDRLSDMV
jgi:hypothetical protein